MATRTATAGYGNDILQKPLDITYYKNTAGKNYTAENMQILKEEAKKAVERGNFYGAVMALANPPGGDPMTLLADVFPGGFAAAVGGDKGLIDVYKNIFIDQGQKAAYNFIFALQNNFSRGKNFFAGLSNDLLDRFEDGDLDPVMNELTEKDTAAMIVSAEQNYLQKEQTKKYLKYGAIALGVLVLIKILK